MKLPRRNLMLRNWKLRRQDSRFSIVFASSVTICSALRRRSLTPNSAPIATRARLLLRPPVFISAAYRFAFDSATISAKSKSLSAAQGALLGAAQERVRALLGARL